MTRTLSLAIAALLGMSGTALSAGKIKAPSPEQLEKGKGLFTVNCVPCHGEKGDGSGPAAVALNPKPRNFAKEPFKQGTKPDEVFKSISTGVKDTPMVGFAHLSEEDRWALTHWVLTMVPQSGKAGGKKKGK